jgi:transposase
MNQHQQIMAEMARQYEHMRDAVMIGPAALAHSVYEAFATGEEEAHIQYMSLEQCKQMARKFLARHCDTDAEENEVHGIQGAFEFSGKLQDRYPLRRQAGEEPSYKLRHLLTAAERAWNVKQLRKSADARNEHADALEAEGQMKASA